VLPRWPSHLSSRFTGPCTMKPAGFLSNFYPFTRLCKASLFLRACCGARFCLGTRAGGRMCWSGRVDKKKSLCLGVITDSFGLGTELGESFRAVRWITDECPRSQFE